MRQTLNSFELLNQVTVASPCSAGWDEMAGDDRVRFCSQCQLHVYDLSVLNADEAVNLIREKEGKVCARFYRRSDGSVLTSDCPVGLRAKARRHWERIARFSYGVGAVVVSCLAVVFVSASRPDGQRRFDHSLRKPAAKPVEPPPTEEAAGRHFWMGKVAAEEWDQSPKPTAQ